MEAFRRELIPNIMQICLGRLLMRLILIYANQDGPLIHACAKGHTNWMLNQAVQFSESTVLHLFGQMDLEFYSVLESFLWCKVTTVIVFETEEKSGILYVSIEICHKIMKIQRHCNFNIQHLSLILKYPVSFVQGKQIFQIISARSI